MFSLQAMEVHHGQNLRRDKLQVGSWVNPQNGRFDFENIHFVVEDGVVFNVEDQPFAGARGCTLQLLLHALSPTVRESATSYWHSSIWGPSR
jgi:hypothetical protein